jgi:ATP-dependent DNA ligase
VLARGYEGLVSKDAPSPYVAGLTRKWLKVKQLHREGQARLGAEEIIVAPEATPV